MANKKEQVHNFLIPEHTKLEDKEVEQVLSQYNLRSVSMLPKIKKGDAALRELGAEVGDVIAIKRSSFAGSSKYYRVVVE